MDVLTDVIETLRFEGLMYGRFELAAPWGIKVDAGREHRGFAVVLQGGCWLHVDGAPSAVRVVAGDLVVLPHGHGYAISDEPRRRTVALQDLVPAPLGHDVGVIRHGGTGAPATLLCGCFVFADAGTNPLLAVLPPLIHIEGERGHAVPWLDLTLHHIAAEISANPAGCPLVLSQLAKVLFVQIVRAYLATTPNQPGSWLRGLTDQSIGRALGLLHGNPEKDWTVAELAHEVGLSRSAFAARFGRLVGQSPIDYLTRWRMHKARGWLRGGDLGLAAIAARVGYETEAAFSKAFKRLVGVAPGAYRRRAGQPPATAATQIV